MTTNDAPDLLPLIPFSDTLPSLIRTRGNAVFDPNQDVWEIQELERVKLRFDTLPEMTPAFARGFRSTLVWYAKNVSTGHLANMFDRARHLFAFKAEATGIPLSEITSVDLINYKAYIGIEKEWYLGSLAGFLKQ